MTLAGTNQDCQRCTTRYSQHYQSLIRSFKYVQSFRQPWLPSFPCPIMCADGENCSAHQSPSIYGAGNCDGCSLFRQYLWKLHSSSSSPVSPYNQTLYYGYERAIIATLEDSSHELMTALASTTQGLSFPCYSTPQQDWWYSIVHPTPNLLQGPVLRICKSLSSFLTRWRPIADHHCASGPMTSCGQMAHHHTGSLYLLDRAEIYEWKHLRMETFTIALLVGPSPLQHLISSDYLELPSDGQLLTPSKVQTTFTNAKIYEWKHLRWPFLLGLAHWTGTVQSVCTTPPAGVAQQHK